VTRSSLPTRLAGPTTSTICGSITTSCSIRAPYSLTRRPTGTCRSSSSAAGTSCPPGSACACQRLQSSGLPRRPVTRATHISAASIVIIFPDNSKIPPFSWITILPRSHSCETHLPAWTTGSSRHTSATPFSITGPTARCLHATASGSGSHHARRHVNHCPFRNHNIPAHGQRNRRRPFAPYEVGRHKFQISREEKPRQPIIDCCRKRNSAKGIT
jgi:hypothetical protein